MFMRVTSKPAPHSGLDYVLQSFYSDMRFCNESVFMEKFLKRIKGKQRGKDSFRPCGRVLVLHFFLLSIYHSILTAPPLMGSSG